MSYLKIESLGFLVGMVYRMSVRRKGNPVIFAMLYATWLLNPQKPGLVIVNHYA